jgi:hypothetical protein
MSVSTTSAARTKRTAFLLAATFAFGAIALDAGAQMVLPGQGPAAPRIPVGPATTPRGNDTTGYWQQRANYTIVATLDERMQAVRSTGTLRYVNRSPDTLRLLWVHQHLNAFRPLSRWSATDEREGRKRFQDLAEPDFAYERFTAPTRINGTPVVTDYPLAPDSTVVRFALPSPLPPGDSITVSFAWDARPSTTPRRQGRRERSYDFAQWYPKVAVYDRGGWKPNALVPAGEFYGEFGDFDVTLVLPNDQVVGATGVPVSGDPGWARVALAGSTPPRLASNAYANLPAVPAVSPGAGYRAVRFVARNVHHFAWSVSPSFRYEGTSYVRAPSGPWRFPIWDTVSVHALYRADAARDCRVANEARSSAPNFEALLRTCIDQSQTSWENGKALRYGITTLRWLEGVYGDYPYPQLTMLKRLDGGGTEFPMMMQNGSASLGLTLHEGGHIYSYGILANNEWQSGWMDEGLTSYQTSLQSGDTKVIVAARLAAANDRDPSQPRDSALARARRALDANAAKQAADVQQGNAEPIGTRADLFRNFGVYNETVYNRAETMYGALHDVMGEEDFQSFLRDYFARWQFRHVDRWAMQGSAERVSKRSLGWFFDQWVNSVGVVDYALRKPVVRQVGSEYVVTVQLSRQGGFRHPMPVGVRTEAGWAVVRGSEVMDVQEIAIRVPAKPDAVWLDPFGSTPSATAHFYRLPLSSR